MYTQGDKMCGTKSELQKTPKLKDRELKEEEINQEGKTEDIQCGIRKPKGMDF